MTTVRVRPTLLGSAGASRPLGPDERRDHRIRQLQAEIVDVEQTRVKINRAVWGIACGVMIYGAINVTLLLAMHGVPMLAAPLLPLMVDLAMCAGLWGDRVMHRYGRRAGWVTALRWITATMTLALNITRPALDADWVGLGIHSCGPLLILAVAEAAGSFQRHFSGIVRELHDKLDELLMAADATPGQAASSDTGTAAAAISVHPYALVGGSLAMTQTGDDARARRDTRVTPNPAESESESETETETETEKSIGTGGLAASMNDEGPTKAVAPRRATTPDRDETTPQRDTPTTPDRDKTRHRDTSTTEEPAPRDTGTPHARRAVMWQHWVASRNAGIPVTGADLDRAARTNSYGRAVIRRWVAEGRITEADVMAARSATSTATDQQTVLAETAA